MRYILAFMCLAVFALTGCGDKTSSATDADSVKPDTDTEQPDADVCPDTNFFCREHDGRYWSDPWPNKQDWWSARGACISKGGRLPTISELRTLIQNCPATETGSACGIVDDCLYYCACDQTGCGGCGSSAAAKYSVFGDIVQLWSLSQPISEPGYGQYTAYYVNFATGGIGGELTSSCCPKNFRCILEDSLANDDDIVQPDYPPCDYYDKPDGETNDFDAVQPDADADTDAEQPEEVQPDADGTELPDDSALIDAYSSGCKNYTRNLLASDEDSEIPDDDSLPATGHYPDPVVNGDQVTVTYVDHYDNCCAAEPVKSMQYGNTQFVIRLYAQEILGGDCVCMCTFDEIWTFKVYESGTYTIEMYWGGIGEIPELIHNYTVEVTL